jgi:isopentenyl-diphosphate delta-isomerase
VSSDALKLTDDSADAILIPAFADDGSLYPIGKMEAHRRGILHVAVSVFVFSGNELLIQRRAVGKYHSGRQWANTCCTHPNWGERVEEAAERRLFEELGVSVMLVPSRVITYEAQVGQGLMEHERVQVFRGSANKAHLPMTLDPSEVSEIRWARVDVLREEARTRPQDFAPWFKIYLARWAELGL